MELNRWKRANDLIERIDECQRQAQSLAGSYWDRRSNDGVSHPSEDVLNTISDELTKMQKLVGDIAHRECG